MRFPLLSAALLACVLVAAGCGSDGGATVGTGSPTTTEPVASTPDAPPPPPDATQPGTGPVAPPPAPATQTQPPSTATRPSDDDDGGGGEQQVRVPAMFVVAASGALRPSTITVPPFLAVELSLRADDGRAHRLVLGAPAIATLDVAAGQRTAQRIAGLRAGRYPVLLDGVRAGALVAGGEVGP